MDFREKINEILGKMQRVPQKLPDEPLTADDWNSLTSNLAHSLEILTAIKDSPPVPENFTYFRFPGMPLPYGEDGVYPDTNPAQWEAVHKKFPGAFMRFAGGNASAFSVSGQVSYDTGVGGDGGGQQDALEEHSHLNVLGGYQDWHSYLAVSRDYYGGWGAAKLHHNERVAGVAGARVSEETRPKNITVEVYVFRG